MEITKLLCEKENNIDTIEIKFLNFIDNNFYFTTNLKYKKHFSYSSIQQSKGNMVMFGDNDTESSIVFKLSLSPSIVSNDGYETISGLYKVKYYYKNKQCASIFYIIVIINSL